MVEPVLAVEPLVLLVGLAEQVVSAVAPERNSVEQVVPTEEAVHTSAEGAVLVDLIRQASVAAVVAALDDPLVASALD